jgi:pilus assembly protein CpaB
MRIPRFRLRTMLVAVALVAAMLAVVRHASEGETVTVVVAIQELPPGEIIARSALASSEFPKAWVPAGAISDVGVVAGRVAIIPISKDEPVLESKLAPKSLGCCCWCLVPRGMRAVCIQAPPMPAGQAGWIMPKDRVDVLFSFAGLGLDGSTAGAITTTFMQRVEILAIDRGPSAAGGHAARTPGLRSVTLLVTPNQANKLDRAQNEGTLHLLRHHPEDHQPPRISCTMIDPDQRFRRENPAHARGRWLAIAVQ